MPTAPSPAAKPAAARPSRFVDATADAASPAALLAAIEARTPLVAAAWLDNRGQLLAGDFESPAVRVAQLDDWLREQATQARQFGREVVAPAPKVRNLHGIVVPVDGGEAIAVLVAGLTEATLDPLLLALRLAASTRGRLHHATQRQRAARHLANTAALVETASRVQRARRPDEALRTLAESVAVWIGADTVAVSLARGHKLRGSVVVAGRADADPRSVSTRRLRAALAETVARGSLGVWPSEAAASMLAQEAAARDCRLARVLSIPLVDLDPTAGTLDDDTNRDPDAAICGALLVGWVNETPNDDRDTDALLQAAAAPLGTALRAAVRGRQRGLARAAATIGRRPLRAMLLTGAALAIAAAAAVPVPYRIACRSECRPVTTRAVVAPHEGLLARAAAEVGESVQAGQPLGRMDDRSLRLELASLTAERTRAAKQRDAHLAADAIAEAFIAGHDVERLSQQIGLLQLRLRQGELRAPTSGVVLASPAERGEQVPVGIGDVLFEVAALDPIRLDVAIPAAEIDHAAPGQTVRFRAEGGQAVREGVISRIQPRSEVRDDAAVFVAEVTLPNPDESLRPGTAGTSRVVTPSRPLAWCLLHRAWESVVMRLGW